MLMQTKSTITNFIQDFLSGRESLSVLSHTHFCNLQCFDAHLYILISKWSYALNGSVLIVYGETEAQGGWGEIPLCMEPS